MDVTREADVVQLVTRRSRPSAGSTSWSAMPASATTARRGDGSPDVMRRMMDVNFMGTFYGARAALPSSAGKARPSDFRLVDRRQARHPVDERLQRDEGRAGGVRGVAAVGIHRYRHSCQRGVSVSTTTEFREAMERDFGHQVSGLGPKQSVDHVAPAIVQCIRRPGPEVYPHRTSRGSRSSTRCPGFTDGLVRKYGRRRAPATPTAPESLT